MSILAAKRANLASQDEMFEQEQAEIIAGLQARQKWVSPKYFYDQRGSELFDEICNLPEYYPTRTERSIMEQALPEIASRVGPGAAVIEFGAGSNVKARQLLAGLDSPAAYVPVEISGEYLQEQAVELSAEFPDLSIKPVVADFTKPFDLPRHARMPVRNLVFFPGSTIGNFSRTDAGKLLEVMKAEARRGGALLIGVDLVKEPDVIRAAYNDSRGVTAAFNLNVLSHLNKALDADFRPDLFRHEAVYDRSHRRIEMRLVATATHTVSIADQVIEFDRDEFIITEYSHKYSVDDLGGKIKNKKFLLDHFNMSFNNDVPLVGIVSRMVAQKGFDIFAQAVNELMNLNVKWIVLGSGDDHYEALFRSLAHKLPEKVGVYIGYNNELAHLIEAGSDMFLMPSLYEPCGLNQIYSLKYGTVPIVKKTGGLADTVHDWDELMNFKLQNGTGFSFEHHSGQALLHTIRRAVNRFEDKDTWEKIQQNGMNKNYSWQHSAEQYVELYKLTKTKRG